MRLGPCRETLCNTLPFRSSLLITPFFYIMTYENEERFVVGQRCKPCVLTPRCLADLPLNIELYNTVFFFVWFNLSFLNCVSASWCCFKGVELLTRHAGLLQPVAPRCSLLANKQQEPERRAESLPSPGQEGRLEAEQRESWSVQPPAHTSTLHPPPPPRLLCNQLTEAGTPSRISPASSRAAANKK